MGTSVRKLSGNHTPTVHRPAPLDEGRGPDWSSPDHAQRRMHAMAMAIAGNHAEKELPQPQPPVEFGFLKVKPDPCMDVT